jgi:hypothetical protein
VAVKGVQGRMGCGRRLVIYLGWLLVHIATATAGLGVCGSVGMWSGGVVGGALDAPWKDGANGTG